MKILLDTHSINSQSGGIEIFSKGLATSLNKLTDLYTYDGDKGSKNYTPLNKSGLYRIIFGLNQAISRFKPDIIHCNNFLPLVIPSNIAKVVTIHDTCFLQEKNFLSRLVHSYLLKRSINLANVVIAVSKETKRQILELSPHSTNVSVIYQGVDIKLSEDKARKRNFIQALALPSSYLLYPTNLTDRKNPLLLNKIAKYLNVHHPKTKIIVTGRNLSRHNLDPNIKVLNYLPLEYIPSLYTSSQGVIYPSKCEGFGRPVIEASALQIPIICSNIASIREIAGKTLWYANNLTQWKTKIKKLIDGKYPKTLLKKAQLNSNNFTWNNSTSKHLKLYESLI